MFSDSFTLPFRIAFLNALFLKRFFLCNGDVIIRNHYACALATILCIQKIYSMLSRSTSSKVIKYNGVWLISDEESYGIMYRI